jgi:diguanylate cyclase (GGDEF)-like protein/PAS domain S-box-containing protein
MQSILLTNLLLAAEKSGIAAFELTISNGEARIHEFTSGFLALINTLANNFDIRSIEQAISAKLSTNQITTVLTVSDYYQTDQKQAKQWTCTLTPISDPQRTSQNGLFDNLSEPPTQQSFWGIFSTEQMQAISKDQTFRSIAENSPDVILRLDTNLRYLYVNQAAERATGWSADRIIGNTNQELGIPKNLSTKWSAVYRKVFETGQPGTKEFDFPTPLGTRSFLSHVVPEYDENGRIKTILSVARDITARKALERELLVLAQTDPLTGLLNRRQFMQECNDELTRAKRYHNEFSIIIVDIDNFKQVNDQFGHAKGDEILILIAELLKQALRENDAVGRLGGDEFCLLLINSSKDEARAIAERVRQSILDIPEVKNGKLPISASVGLAQWSPADDSISTIIQRADRFMYKAKEQGKNAVVS